VSGSWRSKVATFGAAAGSAGNLGQDLAASVRGPLTFGTDCWTLHQHLVAGRRHSVASLGLRQQVALAVWQVLSEIQALTLQLS